MPTVALLAVETGAGSPGCTSRRTVHDPLKSVFEKAGSGPRGEIVARLWFDHYVPNLIMDGTE